jgi:5-methylcytosine-specific restriction protein A
VTNQRFKSASKTPVKTDEYGWPLCRQCEGHLPKGHRYNYCSFRCYHEGRIQSNGDYARECVYKRDRGRCKRCGLDCSYEAVFEATGDYFGTPTQWECHHIVPVEYGGGACGLENLQTLCLACHLIVTKEQRVLRDAARREARIKEILDYLSGEWFGAKVHEIMTSVELGKSQVNEYLKELKQEGYVSKAYKGAPFLITEKGMQRCSKP